MGGVNSFGRTFRARNHVVKSAETTHRHDLAGELADAPVADNVAGPGRVEDLVAPDVDRDVVRSAGTPVAEEHEIPGRLVLPLMPTHPARRRRPTSAARCRPRRPA